MLLAHITFDIPFVIFSVLPKLRQMDPGTYEAALDIGQSRLCGPEGDPAADRAGYRNGLPARLHDVLRRFYD